MTAHTNMARLIREVESNSSGRIIMAQDSNPRRLIIFLCRRSICFRKLKEGGNTHTASHTQHKTYGKKSGGGRGGNRQHRAESWAQLRPVCLVYIVHKAGSARLYYIQEYTSNSCKKIFRLGYEENSVVGKKQPLFQLIKIYKRK
jgi:hypothetical protein